MDSYAFDSRTRAPIRARRRHGPSTGLLLATLVLYVLLVMAGACSRDASAAVAGPTIQLMTATPQQVAAFMPSLSDVQSRVLPALGDAPSVSKLTAQITALLNALNAGDATAASNQIDLARATLASYPAAAKAFDAAELSVIDIMLDRAAQLLGMPPLANRIGG